MSEYDAFEFRVRSDGRRFIANVGAPDFVRKDDVWQCFFFPRGGPEWENITVSAVSDSNSAMGWGRDIHSFRRHQNMTPK